MDIGDVLAIEHDFAAADGFETANGTKERTLSASRGSDKDDEFLFFNLKIDVLKSVKGIVIFLDLSQFQVSHRLKPLKVRFFWGANNAGWVTAARKRFRYLAYSALGSSLFLLFLHANAKGGGEQCSIGFQPVPRDHCAWLFEIGNVIGRT